MKRALVVIAVLACGSSPPPKTTYAPHSGSLALTSDGKTLFVVNPDADSVAVIDVAARALKSEIMLGAGHPATLGDGTFTPAIMPRSVALSPDNKTLYVTGERSGKLYAIDVATSAQSSVSLCSEPTGLVVSNDGKKIFVACSQDDVVARVSAAPLALDSKLAVPTEPWALAISEDGLSIYATQFLGGSVTTIDAAAMTVTRTQTIPVVAPRGDKRLAHGEVRGAYDLAMRPHTSELWVMHQLLGIDTAQPDLDFESTAFPALSAINADTGAFQQTLSTNAQDVPGINGAFADIASGPRAFAFTHDGSFMFMADTSSEDVLIVDARSKNEVALVRPLLGHQPDGIIIAEDDTHVFVQERNTSDVVVLDLTPNGAGFDVVVEPQAIPTVQGGDPMPANLRLGQHLFYSANSDEYPITKNHWVACASCHMEGRSDAVTWRFEQGPRDTPSNAGGMLGTGFLFRTADRVKVQDYWRTIDTEQGGSFDGTDATQQPLLDAIAAYVNYGIPLPVPPTTDAELVAKGAGVFHVAGCDSCHQGPRFTDSGMGNATLDLGATVLLHDVKTCNTGVFPDVSHLDIAGDARTPCDFDTPSLSGVGSSPPYFHDGSAGTLKDAVDHMVASTNAQVSADDATALVEYVRSL